MSDERAKAVTAAGRAPHADARALSTAGLFAAPTLLWGSTWYAITFQLGVVAPEVSVVWRFALAAALLAAWCAATRRPLAIPAREHRWLAMQGAAMYGLSYVCIYRAEQHLASGLLAVLFSAIVFANLAGARLAYGDRMTPRMLAGAALGVGGVALLFLPEVAAMRGDAGTLQGAGFGLASVLLASFGNLVAVRNRKAGIPLLPGMAWGMAYGTLVVAAAAALSGAAWAFDPRPGYVVSLVYLAVFGSVVAFGTYLTLVERIGAGPASYVGVAAPVVAMALSTAFERYHWTLPAVAGIALAVAGNVLVLRPGRAAGRGRTREATKERA